MSTIPSRPSRGDLIRVISNVWPPNLKNLAESNRLAALEDMYTTQTICRVILTNDTILWVDEFTGGIPVECVEVIFNA